MNKKQTNHITAFYLETLLMILVLISIIVVLSGVFGLARVQSVKARELNDAVCLAENAAEAVSASKSPEDLAQLLGGRTENGEIVAEYTKDRRPAAEGGTPFYRVSVSWEQEAADGNGQGSSGGLVNSRISVYGEELLYSIDTAVFVQ